MKVFRVRIESREPRREVSAVIDADNTAHALERAREIYTYACGPLPVMHMCEARPIFDYDKDDEF